jgi:hypothetical protein
MAGIASGLTVGGALAIVARYDLFIVCPLLLFSVAGMTMTLITATF